MTCVQFLWHFLLRFITRLTLNTTSVHSIFCWNHRKSCVFLHALFQSGCMNHSNYLRDENLKFLALAHVTKTSSARNQLDAEILIFKDDVTKWLKLKRKSLDFCVKVTAYSFPMVKSKLKGITFRFFVNFNIFGRFLEKFLINWTFK